tara:strand:- start:489 stop:1094 length:606 start_codon:yes stop_codon:yes gene_type:complete
MRTLVALITLCCFGCGAQDTHTFDIICSEDGGPPDVMHELVEPNLSLGNLSANGQFIEIEPTITTTADSQQSFFQIGLRLPDLFAYDPTFLRIEFTSDKSEWVGFDNNSIEIYDTEDDCITNSSYCEEVILAEGTSGYFEISEGYISIQNAYCRYTNTPYDYTVTARVFDISFWPIIEISDPTMIGVECHPDHGTSQTSDL